LPVCKGTACENSMGAVCLDVTTYSVYSACLVGAIVFAWPGAPAGLKFIIVLLFVLLAWVAGRRYYNWRVRKAKIAAGVARLLESRNAAAADPQSEEAMAATSIQLPVMSFSATRTSQSRRNQGENESKSSCAICLIDHEPSDLVNELPCHHCFHRICLAEWLRVGQATCPSCRHFLAPPDVESSQGKAPREVSIDKNQPSKPKPAVGTKIP